MDPIALYENTKIDQSEVGFTLTSGKPLTNAGNRSITVPKGFMNPLLDVKAYARRYYEHATANFTLTGLTYNYTLSLSNVTSLPGLAYLPPFNPASIPTCLSVLVIVHSPYNVNGTLSLYFDPSGPYSTVVNNEFSITGSDHMVNWVKALNLGANFCSLSKPNEMELLIPLVYPDNIPTNGSFSFGTLYLQILNGPYFGTGVNSVSADIYVSIVDFVTGPLKT